jgi:hypothetical protein
VKRVVCQLETLIGEGIASQNASTDEQGVLLSGEQSGGRVLSEGYIATITVIVNGFEDVIMESKCFVLSKSNEVPLILSLEIRSHRSVALTMLLASNHNSTLLRLLPER